jgi:hypothetical protein
MRVTETMGPAWETMKRALFRPFNIGTWFSFGVVFFLQSCMEGGSTGGLNLPTGNGGGGGGSHGRHGDSNNNLAGFAHDLAASLPGALRDAIGSNGEPPDTGLIVMILAIACVVAIPLILVMYWLGTRGQMMAIRSVAIGQADIGQLWSATRDAGGALFKFHLAVMGISLVVMVPLAIIGVVMCLPMIRGDASIDTLLPALIGLGVVLILVMIPFALVGAMARNFVAPIMLKHGLTAREGWKRFWAVGRSHVGAIIGFFALRILVAIGAGIVGTIAAVFTCCLGFLPVLHQTLMAPYYVFERAWTLEVLASMSPDFDLRGGGGEAPPQAPYGGGGGAPYTPYGGAPTDNPYAPPGFGYDPSGGGGPPPGGFGRP